MMKYFYIIVQGPILTVYRPRKFLRFIGLRTFYKATRKGKRHVRTER